MNQTIKLTRPEKHTQPTTFANENPKPKEHLSLLKRYEILKGGKCYLSFPREKLQQWQQPRT